MQSLHCYTNFIKQQWIDNCFPAAKDRAIYIKIWQYLSKNISEDTGV